MMLTPERLAAVRGEAAAISECHPSKDARAFAESALTVLDAQQARIAELEDRRAKMDRAREKLDEATRKDAARYQYIASACTVILPDGTECEDQQQLDAAMQPTWPEDTSDYGSRIAVIGQNGATGDHYPEQKP